MNTLDTILILAAMIAAPYPLSAQFHTITRSSPIEAHHLAKADKHTENKPITDTTSLHNKVVSESANTKSPPAFRNNVNVRKSRPKTVINDTLPLLTIPNLIAEINKNGIRYPKIVLAQAILETGWFKSSVCRNKHNLFGLTNPRTGEYYEFSHWTESVRAYYTKIQYRYKGGNYLLWLKDIGYAEDPGYIRAVIRVLRQI